MVSKRVKLITWKIFLLPFYRSVGQNFWLGKKNCGTAWLERAYEPSKVRLGSARERGSALPSLVQSTILNNVLILEIGIALKEITNNHP